ncbi:uncharacterized protein VICG_00319 [Vittaforma corneae ATCC 50505]|uniref:Guanylate kinase-like domain-containing protein n=1 Tax=Vittaforma corneae (strain ATCC 50505) TaxID=993615 RepID=L2GQG1_VITCO|nr:uncharacterized protein VICG_00319 [Vittaforma corneae ATCC 50505]ELA42567.1 hypothetical protein VICG_00319 [Vittaforma corneae ATCC 50505]
MASKFLVITGPSGAGKTTVIEYLLKVPLFELSVSYTTREPRKDEIDGKYYFFISKEEFERKIAENFFVEYVEFNGNYYGTPHKSLEEDKIVILDIELGGLRFFKQRNPRSFFCLIKVDRSTMEKRLLKRVYSNFEGDLQVDEDDFKKRMCSFDLFNEVEQQFEFNKIIDNSKSIENTLRQAQDLADEVIEYYDVICKDL